MAPTSPRTKLLIVVLSALLLLIFGLNIWKAARFHVIDTTPKMSSMATATPSIQVNFSQDIQTTGITITTHPSGFTKKFSVSGKVLTIPVIIPTSSDMYYTLEINGVMSKKGAKLGTLTYSFKPVYKAMAQLPEDQQKEILQRENVGLTTNTNDPILAHIPHTTLGYSLIQDVSVTNPDPKKVYLVATISLSHADMSNSDAVVAQRKQDIDTYIRSFGLDPANYVIRYIVLSS